MTGTTVAGPGDVGWWLGTAAGETVGVSSQYTFGTALLWLGVVALLLYALYRRIG